MRFLLLIITAITIVSCNDARKSETFRLLEDVDSYIEARPDSALAVLEGIDKSELTSKELEAKYALLLSQALDKNYIDINFIYMKKALFIIVMLLSPAAVSFAQYAAKPTEEVTLEKQFKIAKNTSTAGIVVASTGAAAWLCGSVMCTVAENRYINSHNTSGSVEEIYDLKQEAKKQSNYKTGQVVEISGYVMVLAGAGTIWIGQSKIKKLNNAANATLSYGVNGAGVALALKF